MLPGLRGIHFWRSNDGAIPFAPEQQPTLWRDFESQEIGLIHSHPEQFQSMITLGITLQPEHERNSKVSQLHAIHRIRQLQRLVGIQRHHLIPLRHQPRLQVRHITAHLRQGAAGEKESDCEETIEHEGRQNSRRGRLLAVRSVHDAALLLCLRSSILTLMKLKLDLDDFRVPDGKPFRIKKAKTKVKDLYKDDAHYESLIAEFRLEIDDLQQKMYAQDRQGLLLVFQAMDAAGKDSTIKHVMSGVNTQGVEVHAFKRPTDDELDHDFLWRTTRVLPPRGRIGIFNRSYYEEVLVCRVHPEIVTKIQRLPAATTKNIDKLFADRSRTFTTLESYCHRNGIRIVKFFLHVSKEEQKKRFLARIDTPSKNWKFEEAM
jgi:PPK2 family polyphosphate:nucleotide phosphotransferase